MILLPQPPHFLGPQAHAIQPDFFYVLNKPGWLHDWDRAEENVVISVKIEALFLLSLFISP